MNVERLQLPKRSVFTGIPKPCLQHFSGVEGSFTGSILICGISFDCRPSARLGVACFCMIVCFNTELSLSEPRLLFGTPHGSRKR